MWPSWPARLEAAAAAVFTQNKVCAAPVTVSREHLLAQVGARAVVANSGNANACTGEQGLEDARQMAAAAAEKLGCDPRQVLVASTGVIGRPMPMDKVRAGIAQSCGGLASGPEAGLAFARAIMTTDTRPKQAGVKLTLRGRTVTVAGATKGVGMVNPNMATVLGFLTTDAAVSPLVLDTLLRNAADATYNCLTVDGHTSTNDTLILLASGLAFQDLAGPMAEPIAELSSPDARLLGGALTAVCCSLSRQIAADAEGGTKVIDVRVTGAASAGRGPPGRRDNRQLAARQDRLLRRRPELGPHRLGRRVRRHLQRARNDAPGDGRPGDLRQGPARGGQRGRPQGRHARPRHPRAPRPRGRHGRGPLPDVRLQL